MKRPRSRRWRETVRASVLVVCFTVIVCSQAILSNVPSENANINSVSTGRRLLETFESAPSGPSGPANCTPNSMDDFPADFLTDQERRQGGVIVHVIITLYIFVALAIVCDDYFVASLESICTTLKIQPDVAGATFMAAGSSAPELFTSIIGIIYDMPCGAGVFVTRSDVGVGTIVGSAVFNVLFIVAICGLFAGLVIHLTWWPLIRDCSYYAVSVAALVAVIHDGQVHWYESLAFLLMYTLYIVIMVFNNKLGNYAMNKVNTLKKEEEKKEEDIIEVRDKEEKQPLLTARAEDEESVEFNPRVTDELVISQKSEVPSIELSQSSNRLLSAKLSLDGEEYKSPLTAPPTFPARAVWLLCMPASFLFMISIPDCRRPGIWQKLYPLTFLMSVAWIAVLSYLMVWMVTVIGDTLRIPDTVMGLTFLAAGTSVPDAMSSLFVARDGYGDMAVSNSIGSNVFDILLCLGLPWFIETVFVSPGSIVLINSRGLTFCAITLFATVIILVLVLFFNKWRLNKPVGSFFLFIYAVVITLSCLYELGIVGPLPLPPCPRY